MTIYNTNKDVLDPAHLPRKEALPMPEVLTSVGRSSAVYRKSTAQEKVMHILPTSVTATAGQSCGNTPWYGKVLGAVHKLSFNFF